MKFYYSIASAGLTLMASHFCVRSVGAFHPFNSNIGSCRNPALQVLRMTSSMATNESLAVEDRLHLLLPFEKSSHNSATIVVNEDENMFDRSTFKAKLEDTVLALKELKKTSVWVEIPMSRASLIEEMVDVGFQFHHAQGKTAKLNLWLPHTESKVPEYATQ